MGRIKMVGCCFVVALAIGAATASASNAAPNWKVNGKFVKAGEEFVVKTKGSVKIRKPAEKIVIKCTKVKDIERIFTEGDVFSELEFEKCIEYEEVGGKLKKKRVVNVVIEFVDPDTVLVEPSDDIIEDLEIEIVGAGTQHVSGNLEGGWNNKKSTLEFPETPLAGSTMQTSGGEEVIISGTDKFQLEPKGKLEVANEPGGDA